MVVRVEPLRHFFGADLVVAAGEREVEVESLPTDETRRDGTQENRGVQDVVVERGRVGQRGVRGVQTELNEARQVLLTQVISSVQQLDLGGCGQPNGLRGRA